MNISQPNDIFTMLNNETLPPLLTDKLINPSVLFHDDFAVAGIPWSKTLGTATVARSTTDAEWNCGGGSMKVRTSSVSAEASELHRYHSKRPNNAGRYVFGGVFAPMDENLNNIAFYIGFRDGTNWYRAKLLHNYSANTWQYDAGGAGAQSMVTLLTRDPSESSTVPRWHHFMLIADLANNKYVDIRIDEHSFAKQIENTILRQSADATFPNLLDFAIETNNNSGTPSASVIIFDKLYAFAI